MMRLCRWSLCSAILVNALLATHFVHAHSASPQLSSGSAAGHVVTVTSHAHFNSELTRNPHSFVKFFHPKCPHCIEIAPFFANLSERLHLHNRNPATPLNRTVVCLQVDISQPSSLKIFNHYALQGVPTLMLFHGDGVTYGIHSGVRTTDAMFDFIMNSLVLFESPPMPHLPTIDHLIDCVKVVGDKPLIISVLHSAFDERDFFSSHVPLPFTEWNEIASSFPTQRRPIFATVSIPAHLVPPACEQRYRAQAAAHAVPPVAIAAPTASKLCNTSRWYFPAVRDSQSLSSFIHTAIIPPGEYIVLSKLNSKHIITTDSPLAFVFGRRERPSLSTEYILQTISEYSASADVIVVYVSQIAFPHVAEHVGVAAITNKSATLSKDEEEEEELRIALYRYSYLGPVVSHMPDNVTIEDWVKMEASALVSSRLLTKAGQVTTLTKWTWSSLFDFDGRGVLLLLTHGKEDRNAQLVHWLSRVARALRVHSGSIVVAHFDDDSDVRWTLPASPNLAAVKERPALAMVVPGQSVTVYRGGWRIRSVSRFARERGEVRTDFGDGVEWGDVALLCVFLVGVVLLCGGVTILYQDRGRGTLWRTVRGGAGEEEKSE